jgi:hypothetical protein
VFEVQETIKKDVDEDAELGSVRHTFFVPNDTGAFLLPDDNDAFDICIEQR